MHAKSGLRVFLKWKIFRPDSVIPAVITLEQMSSIAKPILVLLLLLFCAITLVSWLDPFDDRAFDRADWLAADYTTRAGMADDLIANKLPEGLQRSQVIHLLGEPQGIHEGPCEVVGVSYSNPITYSYSLGCWSGVADDANFIRVQFDAEDRLLAAKIVGY